MDNVQKVYVTEDNFKNPLVEVYLNDLKDRLRKLRDQHSDVVKNSVNLIKEIDEVLSTLSFPPTNGPEKQEKITRIKKLIHDFETAKSNTSVSNKLDTSEIKIDLRRILKDFEELNHAHVLEESLMFFNRAKESFEKIDKIFSHNANDTLACTPSGSVREKVNMFNSGIDLNKVGNQSGYASCCSSLLSIETFHSTEELKESCIMQSKQSGTISLERGYEGDNDDSEYDFKTIQTNDPK